MRVILLLLIAVFFCSCSAGKDKPTQNPSWYEPYMGASPTHAFSNLLVYRDAINLPNSPESKTANNAVKLHTELRLFALSHYLGKAEAGEFFRNYTNLYAHVSTNPISSTNALYALELLEFKWNARWRTNSSELRISPPTKEELRAFAESQGLTAWLSTVGKE